jgi:integrase
MKHHSVSEPPPPAPAPTLQNVVDLVGGNPELSETRRRDLRSAVVTYGKVVGEPLSTIPMDLAAIRKTLDGVVPMQAKVSRKRWANLRSDLAAAIATSGLQPMLKTAGVEPSKEWQSLLDATDDKATRNGLSRLARWASLRQVSPAGIDDAVLERFFSELEAASLVRNIRSQRRVVAKVWNRLVALFPDQGLKVVQVPRNGVAWEGVPWRDFPLSLRQEVAEYARWCSVPDPLDENARPSALAPETLRLRRYYILTAANAACAKGIDACQLTSLSKLVEVETFRVIVRQQWEGCGRKMTPFLADLASTLIVIASEWVKVPADQLAALKKLRSKLGTVKHGLTEKNRTLLRRFDDTRLLENLARLPDRLWRTARRNLSVSKRWFIDLQNALAIDILLHVPLRIENLGALKFDEHLQWPQGARQPALIVIREDETKNEEPAEFELPLYLSDRLYTYRNEIALSVIGRRPDWLFVSRKGKPRTLATLRVAIQRTVLRHIGVKITPHQFRHLGAKIHLIAYPTGHESVRQLLVHKSLRTTTRFYAGPDTRRAGRVHADLIRRLREPKLEHVRRRPTDHE